MTENDLEKDELKEEYDLTKLRVRKVGEGRQFAMDENDELLPEYNFDFSKSKPNRFAEEYWKTKKK